MTTAAATTLSRAFPYVPSAPLRGLVAGVAYEQRGFPAGQHIGLPSHHVTFVIPLDAPLTMVAGPGGAPATLTSCVGGLHAAPVVIGHDGTQVGLHLTVSALGARILFGRPAAELAATVVAADELWGADGIELVDRVHAAASWAHRFAVVDDVLTRHAVGAAVAGHDPAPEVVEAWRCVTGPTPMRVGDVARHVGWSRRHLTQRFGDEFGVTPKTLGRVVRFEQATARLKAAVDGATLATVAAECGYADQAHMARDWRQLAGCSPSAWLAAEVLPFVQDGEPVEPARWAA